jgi:serine/threonine-protein kinase
MIQADRPPDAEPAPPPSTADSLPRRAPVDTAVNLLFGLLALQNNFIDRDALVAAFNAWLAHRSRRLGEILEERGALSASRRALMDELVEEHLQLHGNAPEQSLAALGPLGAAGVALSQVVDPEVRACMAWVLTDPQLDEDRDRTASSGVTEDSTSAGARFQILRPHARGGLGEVFVALDNDLHREVALKEIQTSLVDDPRHRARFQFEAVVTGGLEHPGIVPVYALGHTPDGRPYYAMRFIRGNSLKEAIRRFYQAEREPGRDRGQSALEFRELLGRFKDVCHAIAYAHSRGVIHRDLKPGNIMLGPYGETLVVDWGMAKTMDQSGAERPLEGPELPLRPPEGNDLEPTRAGSTMGTPGYMSPEQAAGRLDQIGPRTDVYGLGATLYHLLTDRAPCEAEQIGEVLQQAQTGNILRPRTFNPRVAPALEAICLKAIAREPERRYDTAAALKSDLERWLADEPVSAWREPWPLRARRWLGRHHTLVAAVAATVLVAAASLAIATVLLQSAHSREVRSLALAEENLKLYHDSIDRFYNSILGHPEIQSASMETLRRDLLELGKEAYEQNLVPRINTPAARTQLGRTYLRYAQILDKLGDARNAEAHFQKALGIFETLNRSLPGDAEYLVDEGRVLCELGRWHQNHSPLSAAIPPLERAVSLLESAARLRPGDATTRYELARTLGLLGRAYSAPPANPLAVETLRRSVADLDALTSEHPEVIEYREGLSRSLTPLAYAYWAVSEFDQGRATAERLCEICEALAAGSPGNPEYQRWLGEAYEGKANLLRRRSPMADEIRLHQKAMRVFETLSSAHPDVAIYKRAVADVAIMLAECHNASKQPSLGRQFADQALSLLERLTHDHPDVPAFRNLKEVAHLRHATSLARLGEHAKAEQEVDQTVRDITSPGWKYVFAYEQFLACYAGCSYAVTAESVLSDASLPPSERADRAAAIQRRAVAQLRRGFEAGYPATLAQFEEWKKDDDIRVLGTDREFRELVSQMEAKLRSAPRSGQEGKR